MGSATWGVTGIELRGRPGSAGKILARVVDWTGANLVAVGSRSVNTITGRGSGTTPTGVARRAQVDVMLVYPREPHS